MTQTSNEAWNDKTFNAALLSASLLGGIREGTSTSQVHGPRLLLLFVTLFVKWLQALSYSQLSRAVI